MADEARQSFTLMSRITQLEGRISQFNQLSQIEQQVISEINRNNLRLDQIIQAVKKMVKSGDNNKGVKKRDFNSTPDKLQPKKLKDRVQKLLNNQSTKYIK